MGNSDVPKFLKLIKEKGLFSKSNNAFTFLFGDEIACENGEFLERDLSNAITYFKQKKINLFFLYEPGGGTTKEYIIEKLIKPLGEQAMLLDFSSTSAEDLVSILKGCISYVVKKKVSSISNKPGVKQISLSNYLKSLGVSNVPAITSGSKKH